LYFWRIAQLKNELAAASVGQRESLLYLLWLGGVTTAAASLPLGEFNTWEYVDSATTLLAFLFGTLYVFSCNGGVAGRGFLVGYVSLNWVLGIRFLVLAAIPTIAAVVVVEAWLMPGGVPEATTPWESLSLVVLEVGFYVRLGHHFREVAAARAAV
jgi:hypothetical protein